MMTKRMKKGGACILALAAILAVLSPGQGRVYGADAIRQPDDGKGCSITFSLEQSVFPEGTNDQGAGLDYYDGLVSSDLEAAGQTAINVKLYKVAEVSASGRYTAVTPDFGTMDFGGISAQTTADDWLTMAEEAAAVVEKENSGIAPERTLNILTDPKAEGLDIGLYLAYVEKDTVKTAEYTYNFTPFLISLPDNNYDPDDGNSDDAWQYHVTVGLKPGRESRLGSLEITKTLDGYNEKLGKALFVFDITAEKNGEIVYSNVASLVFDGTADSGTVTVSDIPAGSVATVTEVYSGSGYERTSQSPAPVSVVASEVRPVSGSVSFTNRYDGHTNGGSGVINHFEDISSDGKANWDCTQSFANPGRQ